MFMNIAIVEVFLGFCVLVLLGYGLSRDRWIVSYHCRPTIFTVKEGVGSFSL